MPINLCNRHFAILRFLREFRAEHGYSASTQEICAAIQINSNSLVQYYLTGLVDAGLITRSPRTARSVILTAQGEKESYRDLPSSRVIPIRLFAEKGD